MQRPYYRPSQPKLKPMVKNYGHYEMNLNPAHRAGGQINKTQWNEINRNNNPITSNFHNDYEQPTRVQQRPVINGNGATITHKNQEPAKLAYVPPVNLEMNENPSESTTDHINHSESFWRVLIDIISLGVLLGAILTSYFLVTPVTRGFSCSNTSIKNPYLTDTIPTYAAVAISVGLPLVVMLITEICKAIYFGRSKRKRYQIRLEFNCCKPLKVYPIIRNLYMLVIVFAYGYLTTWMLVEISKNFVGRLRPHFLAVCQPSFNCSLVSSFEQFFSITQMGTNLTCTNSDASAVREARRSFLSGHAAPMFYGCAFLIMYLHISWSWRHLGILRHVLQTGLAVLACYIGITRITDNQHHPDDVITSGIVGSLVAFAAFRFVLNWQHYTPEFLPYAVPKDPKDQSSSRSDAYLRLPSGSTHGDARR